jgi:hypothetical protein
VREQVKNFNETDLLLFRHRQLLSIVNCGEFQLWKTFLRRKQKNTPIRVVSKDTRRSQPCGLFAFGAAFLRLI